MLIRNFNSSAKQIAMLVAKASENAWPPSTKININGQDKKVLMPLNYVQKIAGKRFLKIYRAFNYWQNVPEEKFQSVDDIMHIFLNTSFLLDDIVDGASSRYGKPAAHCVYSLPLSINAAAYGYAKVTKKLLQLGHPQAVKIYSEALIEEHRGQGIEMYWRDYFQCPTEEEYIDMIKQKTSVFITTAFQLLQLFSERQVDGMRLASLLGVYYQVRDDYCNLVNQKALNSFAENTTNTKQDYYSDITEGKFTLPIIHALQYPEGNELLHVLKQRTHDSSLKEHCISIMKELGSFQYTREVLEALKISVHEEMERLGDNPLMATIMADLNDWRQDSDDHA